MDALFEQAVPMIKKIERAGFEAYFVGGSVRDSIIGRAIHDVDIATSATPQEIKMIFPRTVDVGIEHGTVVVIENHGSYEITTFRTESSYSDFRRPDAVQFVRSLTDDLMRRDFTMNSMAMDKDGTIIDPFHGREAIEQQRIATVGNPRERFHEDALRMMRALRFVSQLGFELDAATFTSLQENGALLQHISIERILVEFEKLVAGPYRVKALQLLVKSGLYHYLPGLHNQQETLRKLATLSIIDCDVVEIWSLLCLLRQEELPSFLKAWKVPSKKSKAIQRIVLFARKEPFFAEQVVDLFQIGLMEGIRAAKVRAAISGADVSAAKAVVEQHYSELVITHLSELAVSGSDIIAWRKLPPGPWVGTYIEKILFAVLHRKIENEKGKIKEWLIQCNLM